jgi:hypothetical protein
MMGPFINATFPMEWYNGDAMSIDELVFFFRWSGTTHVHKHLHIFLN